MDFPIGSLSALILLVLIAFQSFECQIVQRRIMLLGLVGILLASFLTIPLPTPKGVEVDLNVGQAIVPGLLGVIIWLKLSAEDKYHASVGILTVGLLLYGLTALLDTEPGLMEFPMIIAVPLTVVLALLTAKTAISAILAMLGGSTLVMLIRYIEVSSLIQAQTIVELPGSLLWNTTGLSIIFTLTLTLFAEPLKTLIKRHRQEYPIQQLTNEQTSLVGESCEINVLGEEHENNL